MRPSGRDMRAGEQAGGQSPVAQTTTLCVRPYRRGIQLSVPVSCVAFGVTVCCASLGHAVRISQLRNRPTYLANLRSFAS